jgi:Spy/CpxP family protein refolding chaperone
MTAALRLPNQLKSQLSFITWKKLVMKPVLKRLFVSIFACIIAGFTVLTSAVDAQALGLPWLPSLQLADAPAQLSKDWMSQLETEILPQLDSIFTPEQQEQFKTAIANGTTFRKAFKSLTLTPEQKSQLKTLLKSVSKKDAFASLTPEQKQQLFLKKKEMMMPTTDEILDKINTGIKGKGVTLPEGIKEKIDAGLKKKDTFMPTTDEITEKIKAGINMLKDKMED